MRTALVLVCSILVMVTAARADPSVARGRLPGSTVFKACAAAGPFWPTETLTFYGPSPWVACKEQARVVRVDPKRRRIMASLRLDAPVIAVATGYSSIWALDSSSTLYRIRPATARITKRIDLGARAPYNIWIGAGSVWVVDDGAGQVIRVSAATNRVVARISVGDGPADMVFGDTGAWVINHRDRGLVRIGLGSNAATRLATIPGDAPERMARLAGSLWITGRGTDLLQVSPQTGALQATVEIGASGIDVIATADSLWVPTRSAAVDQRSFPTMDALRRVTASIREVTTVATASGRVDVHGLQAQAGYLWIADNTAGVLFRFKT
jgi:DNA-binding beta-propeller fold protein YncE